METIKRLIQEKKKLILASSSPRRRELLAQVGLSFEIDSADIKEDVEEDDPVCLVEKLSYYKARAVAERHPEDVILGADTVVVFRDGIMGKPKDEEDAFLMLTKLSGQTHQVYTGVTLLAVMQGEAIRESFTVCTDVVMHENDEALLRKYISTGEPMDKAGGYGIQGLGAILVKEIHGDYNNVVGLPVGEVWRRLEGIGKDRLA